MQRLACRALLTGVCISLAWTGTASAGSSIDVLFRPSPTVRTWAGGVSASYAFGYATTAISDVVLRTNDPLILASISVAFDNSQGLALAQAVEWVGLVVPVGKTTFQFKPLVRGDGDTGGGSFATQIGSFNATGVAGSFEGLVPPPRDPAHTLPAGTYHLGTIVWDLTGTSAGFHSVAAFGSPSDGLRILDEGGNAVEVSAVLSIGGLYSGDFVPEPGTAALLGFGLVLLATAARRSA
jgi:hypothetical protein